MQMTNNNIQGVSMKTLLATVIISGLMGSVSYAMDWTAQLDLRQQSSEASSCTGTCSTTSQTLFGAGATTKFDMGNNFALRTGGMLTQRGYKQTVTGVSDSINYTYVDVPVLPEYQINDMFTAHAGVVLGLKASRTCDASSNCTGFEDKSMVVPVQIGGTYNIDKQWMARLTYESGSALTSTGAGGTDLKTTNAIALGGGYSF